MNRTGHRGAFVCLCLCVGFLSCSRPVPTFDADRAFADLVRQTEFGPRVPGTDAHQACATWLQEQLAPHADLVWAQPFTSFVPLVDDSLSFTNIIHWDTRPYADNDPDSANWRKPIDGANDGASGVALLLEVARALSRQPPSVGVDIVFFDGEDLGQSGADEEWCLGSRYFTSHLTLKYDWVIIVDLIGDRNLTIYREGYSNRFAKDLQDRVWKIAAELGESSFRPELEFDIIDDHVPFLMHGMPAIDIIDLRYPHWHTLGYTVDKCSAESLGRVGRVILQVLYAG
jgi:hypothetical protein